MSLHCLTPKNIPFGRLPAGLAVAVCLALVMTLCGRDVAAADSPTGKKADPANRSQAQPFVAKPIEPLLTKDQLRACMAQRKSNQERAAEVTRMQDEVLAEKDALIRGAETLKTELATLDRSNADAVNSYNDRASARTRQVADFENKVNEFNAKVLAFDSGRAAYGRDCENRKFDEKDEKALLKEP